MSASFWETMSTRISLTTQKWSGSNPHVQWLPIGGNKISKHALLAVLEVLNQISLAQASSVVLACSDVLLGGVEAIATLLLPMRNAVHMVVGIHQHSVG